jgi:hypothetical protein
VIKPFIINPWMLDAADRLIAYAKMQGLPQPSETRWGFLEGFRRADQDVDRLPGSWLSDWNAASRKSLTQARLLRTVALPHVAIDLQEMPGHPQSYMESFQPDAQGGLNKQLASSLIEARDAGKQIWIKMDAASSLPPAASLLGSRRLGASWWCQPPGDRQDWEAFCVAQEAWSSIILKSPEWDQWVWPWSCLIEQGLFLCAQGKKPVATRFHPPVGLKDRRIAAWGNLGQRLWVSASHILSDGGWEDLWIGLVCAQLGFGGALADEDVHAINGAHKENDRV